MTDRTIEPIYSVEDVVAYLYNSLANMRTYPMECEFQEGYERAFNDVMYHLVESGKSQDYGKPAAIVE